MALLDEGLRDTEACYELRRTLLDDGIDCGGGAIDIGLIIGDGVIGGIQHLIPCNKFLCNIDQV